MLRPFLTSSATKLAALLFGFTSASKAAKSIQIPDSASLSKDGKTLFFGWAGDIWTATPSGGEARRLTHHPAPDDNALAGRKGKWIYFNSTRTGSLQVFRIPVIGGAAEQLTFHTEGSRLEDLHPTKDRLLVSGTRDHAGRRPTRLIEKSFDTNQDEIVLFDVTARSGKYSPDGEHLLITRGGSPPYRKGYVGSQASRIWLYNFHKKSFTEPVSSKRGCRYPVWAPDGLSFFYVSARSGAFNIWQHRFGETNELQITQHPNDGVFIPALSADGSKIIYRHLFDLYSIETKTSTKPEKLKLFHRSTLIHPEFEALTLKSTKDATVTKSGLEWAFVAEGEIWAMDTVLKEPHRLTSSPAHESDIYFSDKGDYLYYLKDNGVTANYWRMSKTLPKQFWWDATEFSHQPVTKGSKQKLGFSFSPKGDQIAYVEYPGTLYIAQPDGSEARKILELWDTPDYVWSPDGSHLAYAATDGDYNNDIFIIATDGKSKPVNVSRHPDNEYSPRWSPDGKILAFTGRRHSTSTDLFFVHLQRESHFKTDRDDRITNARKEMVKDPLYKPKKKKKETPKEEAKEKKPEEEEKEKAKKDKEDEKKKPEVMKIDFEDLHKRIQRIKLNDHTPRSLHWRPDSKTILFQSGNIIHEVTPKAGAKPSTFYKGSGTIIRFASKVKLHLLSNNRPALLNKGRLTSYSFSIPFQRNRKDHQRMGFRLAWRSIRDIFYDPALNNRDWDSIRSKYELAAAECPTNESFRRIMSMLLGELNASHMGFYPSNWPKQWKFNNAWRSDTPHLGLRLNGAYQVTYIHPNGPADRPKSRISVGERITHIDGKALRSDQALTRLLNGRMDRDIVLTVVNEAKESREVTLRPISFRQARALAQNAHLDERREKVEKASDGKLGYLHVARMAWDEFEKFEHHVFERGAGKDGLIIDVRDNGGGFTADHLLTVLTQPRHAFTVGRNGLPGYPQDRKVYASWNKPIVVLCNENSFSNAEIFSHAIKSLKRGKLVGVPTAGGVISTWSTTVLDLGRMRLPGRGWFLPNGQDMELHGAEPHFIVDVTPGDLPAGRDPQLEVAINVLKQEVQEKGVKLPKAIYRSQRN